ncbi:MAG: hypothetical protein OXN17_10615 [Candidatus Poribacteria bacterium]|nr:hypothetical protein [Candidatus Poribacteria bacterium]MDE0506304.1 hypothetical protein [Candidatus Poribacteria bacterium]
MRFVRYLLLLCLTVYPAYAQLPVVVNTSSVANSEYEVNLVNQTPVDPENPEPYWEFEFEIRSKARGKISHITIGKPSTVSTRIKSITNLHLFDGNLFIVEGKRRRARTISVVDLRDGKDVNHLWCYKQAPSPSKRFWVFQKFFTYGSPTTSVVLCYDMKKLPRENLTPEGQLTPIYPGECVAAGSHYVRELWDVTPGPDGKSISAVLKRRPHPWYHGVTSPFLWSHDERQVVFLCVHLIQGHDRTHIVRVDLSGGIDKPKIFSRPILITSDFVKPEYKKRFQAETLTDKPKYKKGFGADAIEWLDSTQVKVKVDPHYRLLKQELILHVP